MTIVREHRRGEGVTYVKDHQGHVVDSSTRCIEVVALCYAALVTCAVVVCPGTCVGWTGDLVRLSGTGRWTMEPESCSLSLHDLRLFASHQTAARTWATSSSEKRRKARRSSVRSSTATS